MYIRINVVDIIKNSAIEELDEIILQATIRRDVLQAYLSTGLTSEEERLLYDVGDKIACIREVRNRTNLSLKQVKEIVDWWNNKECR